MQIRFLSLLSGCLWLAGCSPGDDTYEQQLFAFGTLVDISVYGVPPDQARQAVQAVDALLQKQHRDWHAWQRGVSKRSSYRHPTMPESGILHQL